MFRAIRLSLATVLLGALTIGSVAPVGAGGPKILDASMTGIPVAGMSLDGIAGGGVAWVLDSGNAKLFADGRLQVRVDGLVLVTTHENPVPMGRAIVTCGNVAVASSAAVPFSRPGGDAQIATRVNLPHPCLAPAVFFAGVTANGDRWFAVTGN
jgi:hypothetical protein